MMKTSPPLRIGQVFQEIPGPVREAWDRFRPILTGDLNVTDKTFFDVRRELKEACARVGKHGYFILDGYLVGWSQPFSGRRFTIILAAWSIRKEERPC